jgi:hypothetical protein
MPMILRFGLLMGLLSSCIFLSQCRCLLNTFCLLYLQILFLSCFFVRITYLLVTVLVLCLTPSSCWGLSMILSPTEFWVLFLM